MENTDYLIQDELEVKLIPAHPLKRLLNYFIDIIIFSLIISFVLGILSSFSLWASNFVNTLRTQGSFTIGQQLVITFLFGLYISLTEAVLKGKTLGKYMTGTRAVSEAGQRITAETAFVRGLIRMIPFEQFSILFDMPRLWHDSWSKTIVVDEKVSILPRQ